MPGNLAALRAFPDAFTKDFEDNFSFRARLVKWQAAFRFRELNVSPSPTVIAGRDGFLFYADDGAVEDFADVEPFTTAELEIWRETLQKNQDWLTARGINYLFVIAPDKHVVYPELMPAAVHRINNGSRIDQLVDYLHAHSTVNVADLRQPLLDASRRERLYHRTDTHWNDISWRVLRVSANPRARRAAVGQTVRARRLRRSRRCDPRDGPGRDDRSKDVLSEDELRLVPHQPRRAKFLEPAHPDHLLMDARIVTEVPDRRLPRLMVFRDSFSSALVPFLSEHFSRAVYLWQYNFDPVAIEQEQPDIVIHEWVGRRLGNKTAWDAGADFEKLASSIAAAHQSALAVRAASRVRTERTRVDRVVRSPRTVSVSGIPPRCPKLIGILRRRERQRQHRRAVSRLDPIQRIDDHLTCRFGRRRRHVVDPEHRPVAARHDRQRRLARQGFGGMVVRQIDDAPIEHLVQQLAVAKQPRAMRRQQILVGRGRQRHPRRVVLAERAVQVRHDDDAVGAGEPHHLVGEQPPLPDVRERVGADDHREGVARERQRLVAVAADRHAGRRGELLRQPQFPEVEIGEKKVCPAGDIAASTRVRCPDPPHTSIVRRASRGSLPRQRSIAWATM